MKNQIIEAIENMNVIEFSYDGENRVVEPHCFGVTTEGNDAIRAFQVDGYSSSGRMGWKLYDLSKMDDLSVLEEIFEVRDDYKPGDKGMVDIYIEI
jgi:hypothetical protein